MFNLSDLQKQLIETTELTKRISALDEIAALVESAAEIAVSSLEHNEGQLFIAERIYKLGTVAVKYLETLYRETKNPETKKFCALTLLQFGSTVGVEYLLAIMETDKDACLIAKILAKTGIEQAAQKVVSILGQTDHLDLNTTICFLDALNQLNTKVPDTLKAEFIENIKQRIMASDFGNFDKIANSIIILELLEYKFEPFLLEYLSKSDTIKRLLIQRGIMS
jgi:hypothetical protein